MRSSSPSDNFALKTFEPNDVTTEDIADYGLAMYGAGSPRTEAQLDLSPEEQGRSDSAVALPPVDGGRGAWTFVFCSFILEMVVWGFPYSFGVFQQYYLTTPPFDKASESVINSIGTVAIAVQFFLTPFCIALASRHQRWIPRMCWSALGLYTISLFVSSFAETASQLLVLQGVIIGISGGILYAPVFVWLSEWFVDKRALGAAIIFGGSGIGGTFFPLLINVLLTRTGGIKWTLRILSLMIAVCGSIALLGVKPRVPITSLTHQAPRRAMVLPDLSFMKSYEFMAMSVTIMAQGLAYYPVSLYIPAFSTAVGLSTVSGTTALSVFNLSGVVGQIIFGHACDKMDYTNIIVFSGIGSALSAFLMWGFAKSIGMIFAFVVVFGSISGGFSSTAPAASRDIAGPGTQSALVFGAFEIFKGISVIIGPIISANLHKTGAAKASVYGGYGFTQVELFVGSMMVVTTLGGVATRFFRPGKSS